MQMGEVSLSSKSNWNAGPGPGGGGGGGGGMNNGRNVDSSGTRAGRSADQAHNINTNVNNSAVVNNLNAMIMSNRGGGGANSSGSS